MEQKDVFLNFFFFFVFGKLLMCNSIWKFSSWKNQPTKAKEKMDVLVFRPRNDRADEMDIIWVVSRKQSLCHTLGFCLIKVRQNVPFSLN